MLGTIFLGKVKQIQDQSIQTKFFIFILPIYPIESMLVLSTPSVNKRLGIILPELDKKSVLAGYTRLTLLSAAIIVSLFGWKEKGLVLIISILLIALWAFLSFVFGKPTSEETIIRKRIGSAIGVYILPEWMDRMFIHEHFPILETHYKKRFNDASWKDDLQQNSIPVDKRPMLYTLALMESIRHPTPDNKKLFEKIDSTYRKV